jgi:hypothetical protein
VVGLLAASFARAETDSAVEPATAIEPRSGAGSITPAARVRFEQQATQVGDRVVQRIGAELTVAMKIVQSGQVAHESTTHMRRQQQRTIDVLEVAEGRVAKARVSFQASRRQSPENADPNDYSAQLIEGKTYLMHRTAERLNVTDAAGLIPPLEEYKLVMESLESVGKPNPLAELLAGRTLAVGEHLHVPREMARTVLGLGDQLGTVRRFELSLARLDDAKPRKPAEAAPQTAVFKAHIEVAPNDVSPLSVTLGGELAIEPASCRLLSIDLAGPVTMSSIERTAGGIFQYTAGGELRMAMRSQFGRDE